MWSWSQARPCSWGPMSLTRTSMEVRESFPFPYMCRLSVCFLTSLTFAHFIIGILCRSIAHNGEVKGKRWMDFQMCEWKTEKWGCICIVTHQWNSQNCWGKLDRNCWGKRQRRRQEVGGRWRGITIYCVNKLRCFNCDSYIMRTLYKNFSPGVCDKKGWTTWSGEQSDTILIRINEYGFCQFDSIMQSPLVFVQLNARLSRSRCCIWRSATATVCHSAKLICFSGSRSF